MKPEVISHRKRKFYDKYGMEADFNNLKDNSMLDRLLKIAIAIYALLFISIPGTDINTMTHSL